MGSQGATNRVSQSSDVEFTIVRWWTLHIFWSKIVYTLYTSLNSIKKIHLSSRLFLVLPETRALSKDPTETFRGTSRCLGDGCGSPAGAPERRHAYSGGGAAEWDRNIRTSLGYQVCGADVHKVWGHVVNHYKFHLGLVYVFSHVATHVSFNANSVGWIPVLSGPSSPASNGMILPMEHINIPLISLQLYIYISYRTIINYQLYIKVILYYYYLLLLMNPNSSGERSCIKQWRLPLWIASNRSTKGGLVPAIRCGAGGLPCSGQADGYALSAGGGGGSGTGNWLDV